MDIGILLNHIKFVRVFLCFSPIFNGNCFRENLRPSYCSINICVEIFDKFKDEKGGFKETLIPDVQGMLGLYEASHLKVHGEDILEEALAFTTTHLKAMVESLRYPLAEQVSNAMKRPIRKGLERLEARWYISIYQDEASHDETLLKLAKLDFNLVQSLHKEELSNLSRLVFESLHMHLAMHCYLIFPMY